MSLRTLIYLALIISCWGLVALGDYPVRASAAGQSGLTQLKAELAEKQNKYSDHHPDIIRLKNEIAAIEHGAEKKEPSNEKIPSKPHSSGIIKSSPNFRSGDFSFESTLRQFISVSREAGKEVTVPIGTHFITKNLTIPRQLSLKFERGAILHVQNGSTLIINGTIEAGSYQIFSWDGSGKIVLGNGSVKEVLIRWWGAVGDGISNDTKAVQAAIDLLTSGLSASLVGSAGDNYLVDNLFFNNSAASIGPNQRFSGNGATLSQAGLGNIINITNRSGRLSIDHWKILGTCQAVWVQGGFLHKPDRVTFDDHPGIEVSQITAVNNYFRWCFKDGKIYIFAAVGSQNNPEATYHNPGIKVDGKIVSNWSRFFSGTAVYMGAKHGVANIDISKCTFRYFDKVFDMHYSLYNSIRDCDILGCNTAIYGEQNHGNNNINLFDNLRIAAVYGEAAIYWKDSYGVEFRHCVVEVFLNRLFHLVNCNAVKIDNIGMEAVSIGCKVHEVCLFDNVSGLNIVNSSLWAGGGGSQHALTSFFRFIHHCAAIRVGGNVMIFTDSPEPRPSKIAIYSTDGTATGLSFRNNDFRCPRWTTDSNPSAACDNNSFPRASWVTMPISMVRNNFSAGDYRTTLSFSKRPESPSYLKNVNSVSTLDSQAGVNAPSSWKITWQGENPKAILANVFSFPPAGTYTGVLTLFYKSDQAQTFNLNLISSGGYCDNIPLAGDGQWRCLSMITSPVIFPQKIGPHGLMITTDAASGNLWLSHVSLQWFANRAEAEALVGGVAPEPSSNNAVK